MNREIKFRGLRVDNGKWIYGYYGILGGGTDLERHVIMESTLSNNSIPNFYFTDIEIIPKSIGQFTGLHDKDGVEIYEKDYVLDSFGQRILVECDFSLLSRLEKIQKDLLLNGNYHE